MHSRNPELLELVAILKNMQGSVDYAVILALRGSEGRWQSGYESLGFIRRCKPPWAGSQDPISRQKEGRGNMGREWGERVQE